MDGTGRLNKKECEQYILLSYKLVKDTLPVKTKKRVGLFINHIPKKQTQEQIPPATTTLNAGRNNKEENKQLL